MSRRNHDDDDLSGLLVWGIILLITGVGSGIGILLLSIYVLKKVLGGRNNELRDNIKSAIDNAIENAKKSVSDNLNANNIISNNTNTNNAKTIIAEKVETVKKTTPKAEPELKVRTSGTENDYTTQEIMDKLDYYNSHECTTNDEILEKISTLNKMLNSLVPKIDKLELQNDIKDINKTIDKILKALKRKKSKIKKINNFSTYYLPVTLKILIKYDEVENLKLDSQNSNEFMSTVEDKVKMIKDSFHNQLESLYVDDFDDVEAELNVLESMLKSDGYTDLDDFNLRGNKK